MSAEMLRELGEYNFCSGHRCIRIPDLIYSGRQGLWIGGLDCIEQNAAVHIDHIVTLQQEDRRLLRMILGEFVDLRGKLLSKPICEFGISRCNDLKQYIRRTITRFPRD